MNVPRSLGWIYSCNLFVQFLSQIRIVRKRTPHSKLGVKRILQFLTYVCLEALHIGMYQIKKGPSLIILVRCVYWYGPSSKGYKLWNSSTKNQLGCGISWRMHMELGNSKRRKISFVSLYLMKMSKWMKF